RAGNFQAGIDALRRIPEQNAALVPEALDTLRSCYDALDRREQLVEFLRQCLTRYPSTRVALAIAEEIRHQEGGEAAAEFLSTQMRARPALRGLQQLIPMPRAEANTERTEDQQSVL